MMTASDVTQLTSERGPLRSMHARSMLLYRMLEQASHAHSRIATCMVCVRRR